MNKTPLELLTAQIPFCQLIESILNLKLLASFVVVTIDTIAQTKAKQTLIIVIS